MFNFANVSIKIRKGIIFLSRKHIKVNASKHCYLTIYFLHCTLILRSREPLYTLNLI